MSRHVAASAYGHCLALVRDEAAAADLAGDAVRRGGRSLAMVLRHARHQAVAYAAANPPSPVELPDGAGPSDAAWALAATRPAAELAVVDLGRYGLSRSGLGTALRSSPTSAAARLAAVSRAWDAELDPALLAWLGPGDCDELADVMAGRPRATPDDLLVLAGDVAEHAGRCAACADRQRAMPSVRLLVSGTPLPVPPPTVVAAAAAARLQPPVPAPPLERRPARRLIRAVVGAAAAVAAVGATAFLVDRFGAGDTDPTVAVLSQAPLTASPLELAPATVELAAGRVDLVNRSDTPVRWEAAVDAAWLSVSPDEGRLPPGATQVLRLQGSPPEGEVRAAVRVSAGDGSAVAATLVGTAEHPPDLDALVDGCEVQAAVEDEGDVTVTLHWRDAAGAVRTTAMPVGETGARAPLPSGVGPGTWWVSAVDGRGNQARTPDTPSPGC